MCDIFYVLRDLLFKKDWEYGEEGILDRTHRWFFTNKSMHRMFDSAGYEVVRSSGITRLKSWKVDTLNCIFFGNLADTFFMQYAFVLKPLAGQNGR